MDAEHSSILNQLGIRSGEYKGGEYAEYAVSLVLEDYNKMINVTRVLYPEVAKHFGTTPSCVEKDMRMVVQKAWERNPDLLCEWAGYPSTGDKIYRHSGGILRAERYRGLILGTCGAPHVPIYTYIPSDGCCLEICSRLSGFSSSMPTAWIV